MIKNTKKYFNKLIKRMARRDENALEEFYRIYGRLIYATAITVLKSYVSADEVVDDLLIKIWKTADKLTKISNPEGWLYVLTVNSAKDKLKSEKQYAPLYDLKEDAVTAEIQTDGDFYIQISNLNETEQEIMIMRFVEDLSFERIAREMEKPLSTITSTYYRALEKLKQ